MVWGITQPHLHGCPLGGISLPANGVLDGLAMANLSIILPGKARRTLELSAELSGTSDCWRKLFPQVCGDLFCDFLHAS